MRRSLFLFVLLTAITTIAEALVVEKPTTKNPTSFAIILDEETYNHTKDAVSLYRDAIEKDHLSTYLIYDTWKTPQALREVLKDIYKKDPQLEGIVLIGDIPVACIRNAQHMTSAFKMNEKTYPFIESSVPSDRFYDDLHLSFDYIKQDSTKSSFFYYKLREDAPQQLNPTFYSARIKYPDIDEGHKYEAISAFLEKAARLKATENALDYVVSFNGASYNSDCLTAWIDEMKAYRENFPEAFKGDYRHFKHLNFRMDDKMKFKLMDELQRPEVDLFMFHEHGMPTEQLINNLPAGNGFTTRYESMRNDLYSYFRKQVKKGERADALKSLLCKEYHLLPGFFDLVNDPSILQKDSMDQDDTSLSIADLNKINTYPRFVMLDACYNGSFQDDDYIAAHYLFNKGNTLSVQGNTRNVLQDRWTIELVGLLSYGMRVGQYNQLVATLEGHLMGDPTQHFQAITPSTILEDFVVRSQDESCWEKYLQSPYADVRALALRQLSQIHLAKNDFQYSKQLLHVFQTSSSDIERMEALKLLSSYRNEDFYEAVLAGLDDSYELIARKSANFAGRIGSPRFADKALYVYINTPNRLRAAYNLETAFDEIGYDVIQPLLFENVSKSSRYDGSDDFNHLNKSFSQRKMIIDKCHSVLMNKKASLNSRIGQIRTVRNNNYAYRVNDYLKILADNQEPEELRVNVAETLGWFVYSFERPKIVDICKQLLQKEDNPSELTKELTQTINRLK